ncbi:hypothetical protein EJ05DRAFT_156420 [Pseudovirgaria hyperparasitica]|uniref:Uncharacterized protein n=1 Tax=Pseudovirgaria hyperparasitica TaxID=470096 RepID=A0A6A6VVZ8_9PEZI|nr:uncharacterized protein EJ05DRAFT_156420 [Pseudovirgaria hyperparasitica]KAF2754335.1 hypothetical protein EJ05DRAFT_156420 [Pseudovirgaria hyperparasitica]
MNGGFEGLTEAAIPISQPFSIFFSFSLLFLFPSSLVHLPHAPSRLDGWIQQILDDRSRRSGKMPCMCCVCTYILM